MNNWNWKGGAQGHGCGRVGGLAFRLWISFMGLAVFNKSGGPAHIFFNSMWGGLWVCAFETPVYKFHALMSLRGDVRQGVPDCF